MFKGIVADLYVFKKNFSHKVRAYSVTINNKTYFISDTDFIQGYVTGAQWTGTNPYTELLDFSSYDKDNVKTELEINN
jgi:hypothetical protein